MSYALAEPLLEAFEQHYDQLIAHVRRKVGCAAAAADIVQETYVRLRSSALPAAVENPRAFIYRVATNLAINHIQQQRARGRYVIAGPLPEEVVSDDRPVDARLSDQQLLAHMAAVVDELPPRCREVFILRKFHHLKMEEIAVRLDISLSMAEKHLRRAVLHCTARQQEFEGAPGAGESR
ncbi:RNA polymerase sigma factor [Steroidobacter flavus]|uniref:RNA polymerase sigma factor n=1 Tax=Steroidobacter flavus TaxID=1842136 RepID=A0ABV8SZL1_9GAMM